MQTQKRNDELQAILTADLLPATDRNLAIEVYNSTEPTFDDDPPVTAPFSTTRLNTAPSLYSLASDAITVALAGVYMVNYHITILHNAGAIPAVGVFWLEQDPATGSFSELAATKTFIPIHEGSYGSGQVVTVTRALAGYKYRVRGQRDYGNDVLKFLSSGGCRLSIVCLCLTP